MKVVDEPFFSEHYEKFRKKWEKSSKLVDLDAMRLHEIDVSPQIG